MLDLNDMRFFAAVAEQGSFTVAAKVLNVPKSSLSRRVLALEDELGARLLQRSTRSLAITDLGQQFYQHCRAMLIEAQAAQEVAINAHAQPCGTVQIACPNALLQMRVAAVLADYLQRYPQVQLKVLAVNRAVDVIAEGVDIALRVREEPLEDSELALRPLGLAQEVLVASPALLSEYGQPASPADLPSLPSLAQMAEQQRWQLQDAEGKKRSINHQPRLQCSDFPTLLQAALAGLGVAQLPLGIVQAALDAGALQQVLPEWKIPSKNIHAVFASRRGQLSAVRVLLDMLSTAFATPDAAAAQQ